MRPSSTLLAVTGLAIASHAVFAGTFEEARGRVSETRFGLTRGDVSDVNTIDYWTDWARQHGWYPRSLAIYGVQSDRRYAAIWERNPDGIYWSTEGLADSAEGHQARLDALAPLGARPAHVSVSSAGEYASVVRDDAIGEWTARHNMTGHDYRAQLSELVRQGYIVSAGGAVREQRRGLRHSLRGR